MAAEAVLSLAQDESEHAEGPSTTPVAPSAGLPLATLLVVAALAAALLAQGGYYGPGQRLLAVFVVAAAVIGLRGTGVVRHPIAWAGAALAAWSVLSAVLAGVSTTAAASTVLVLTAAIVVVFTCAHLEVDQRDQLAVAVIGLGVAVAVSGWAGVAWHRAPLALQDQGLWRAATTLTYANAAAGFLAAIALLSLGRSTASPPSASRAATTFVLLTGLGATLSRGGLIASVVGTLVLVRLLGTAAVVRHAAAPALGALVALAGLWPSFPSSSPARPLMAAGALAAGLLVTVATVRLAPRRLLALTAVSAAVLAAAGAGPARDTTARMTSARLTVASPDRVEEVGAALRLAATRPLSGVGPGQADLSWTRSDGAVLVARYAHNEYVQVLAELGVVGLGLLLALLAAVSRAIGRSPTRLRMRPVWAGVTSGLVALGVHGLFDFGWHLPAIALTGAVLVGIATTNNREDQA